MTDLFKFALGQDDISGTVLQQRIDSVTQESFDKRATYSLKSGQTLNRNASMFTEEQISFIKSELKEFLYFFGYVKNDQDLDNLTPFFDFDHSAEDLAKY